MRDWDIPPLGASLSRPLILVLLAILSLAVAPAWASSTGLAYDDGSAEFSFRAGPGTVAAVKFDNPQQRTLTELHFYIWGETEEIKVYVLNGQQQPTFSRIVTTPGKQGWFTVPVPELTPSETFYVGWEWLGTHECPPCTWLGVDTDPPHHYRSYLGSLGNLQLKKDVPTDGGVRQEDYMIRATVTGGSEPSSPELVIPYLRTDKREYRPGEKMAIHWAVKNVGSAAVTFTTQLVFYGPNGAEITRDGKAGPWEIQPGETIEIAHADSNKFHLPQDLQPGTYTLKAMVWYANTQISKSTRFTVVGTQGQEIKVQGKAVEKKNYMDSAYWIVDVNQVLFGPQISGHHRVLLFMSGCTKGTWDEDVAAGDKVEVYGRYRQWSEGEEIEICSSSNYYLKKLQQNQPPDARFNYDPASPSVRDSVSFTAADSSDPDGRITGYAWDFNDDGRPDRRGQRISYQFASAGHHRVTLTVTDDSGATDSTTKTIQVGGERQSPTARFTYSPSRPKAGTQVTFNAADSQDPDGRIDRYQWDFDGDGQPDGHGQQATHTFSSAGERRVTLTVIDNDGLSASTSQTLNVRPKEQVAAIKVPMVRLLRDGTATETFKPGDTVTVEFTVKNDGSIPIDSLSCQVIVWAPWAGSAQRDLSNVAAGAERTAQVSWAIPQGASSGQHNGQIICRGEASKGTVVPTTKPIPSFHVKPGVALLKVLSVGNIEGEYEPGDKLTLDAVLKNEGSIPIDRSLTCRAIVSGPSGLVLTRELSELERAAIPPDTRIELSLSTTLSPQAQPGAYSGSGTLICQGEASRGNVAPLPGSFSYDFAIAEVAKARIAQVELFYQQAKDKREHPVERGQLLYAGDLLTVRVTLRNAGNVEQRWAVGVSIGNAEEHKWHDKAIYADPQNPHLCLGSVADKAYVCATLGPGESTTRQRRFQLDPSLEPDDWQDVWIAVKRQRNGKLAVVTEKKVNGAFGVLAVPKEDRLQEGGYAGKASAIRNDTEELKGIYKTLAKKEPIKEALEIFLQDLTRQFGEYVSGITGEATTIRKMIDRFEGYAGTALIGEAIEDYYQPALRQKVFAHMDELIELHRRESELWTLGKLRPLREVLLREADRLGKVQCIIEQVSDDTETLRSFAAALGAHDWFWDPLYLATETQLQYGKDLYSRVLTPGDRKDEESKDKYEAAKSVDDDSYCQIDYE